MAKKSTETTLRKCIGSTRYGIEAHEAPAEDFPVQPSQKDGLGRKCKTHWVRHEALTNRAVLEGHRGQPVAAGW